MVLVKKYVDFGITQFPKHLTSASFIRGKKKKTKHLAESSHVT